MDNIRSIFPSGLGILMEDDDVRECLAIMVSPWALTKKLVDILFADKPTMNPDVCWQICTDSGMFIHRNDREYHIEPEYRQLLLNYYKDGFTDESLATHLKLLEVHYANDRVKIPGYLFWPAGRIYHHAIVSPIENRYFLYQSAYDKTIENGNQWLLKKTAEELERRGLLPPNTVEKIIDRW